MVCAQFSRVNVSSIRCMCHDNEYMYDKPYMGNAIIMLNKEMVLAAKDVIKSLVFRL